MTRQIRLLLLALLAALVVLVPRAAVAHDELIGTDPEDSARVEAPEELTLTFSGQIAEVGATVVVNGPDGTSVLDGDPQVEGTDVVQPLADGLEAGDYEVVWRVTSQDGHPISGEFGFAVTGDPAAAGSSPAEDTSEPAEETTEPAEETTESAPTTTEAATSEAEPTPATADPTTDQAEDATSTSGTGMPVWAWAAVAAGVALLLYALSVTVRNNRR